MAHIWYEGTSHRYTSPGTKVKVICKDQCQYQGHVSQKMRLLGALVFHKHILFLLAVILSNLPLRNTEYRGPR